MRRLLWMFLELTVCLGAVADEYDYLSFVDDGGTVQTFVASGLTITFTGEAATVVNGSQTATLPLSSLAKMYFSDEQGVAPTAIQNLDGDGQDGSMTVYTLSGNRVGSFASADELKARLRQGVYVLKTNGRTQKVTVK